jgi:8-oxo-dGTP pyrophosphatase MutT (NUDIX family)
MELLKIIKEKEAHPELRDQPDAELKVRKAVRAVIFNNENKVALLHVSKHNYYKLPGGGIEETESPEKALRRECQEEAGCDVSIGGEIGEVIEYRNKWDTRQESQCYFAKVMGELGNQNLQGYEVDSGFLPVWADIDEAIELVSKSAPVTYDGPFIVIRDALFLKKAKEIIKK